MSRALAASGGVGEAQADARSDLLLTADDVATLLNVTAAWVYAEARCRRIPHLRLGRYIRFRRGALEAWMDKMERSSTRR
ncbi:MAG: helix-turn-helix domain-containing protein [Solirubrobacteraceae bacterium]